VDDVVAQCGRADGGEGPLARVALDHLVEGGEVVTTSASADGQRVLSRFGPVLRGEDDRLVQPCRRDRARPADLGGQDGRSSQRVAARSDRLIGAEVVDDRQGIVDHAPPGQRHVGRDAVAVAPEVGCPHVEVVVQPRRDLRVAAAVEPGRVKEEERRTGAAEIVERDDHTVGRLDHLHHRTTQSPSGRR
jgi:hypothetical protein